MRKSSVSSGQPSVENGHSAGAEPRVEHVGILREIRAAALRALRRRACGARVAVDDFDARIDRGNHFLAIGAMPDGNAMAPPELARDAPVANIFDPLQQDGALIFGHDLDQCRRRRLPSPARRAASSS